MELIDYVVTLKNKEDLDSFYQDMETPGGNIYIPHREVSVTLRRPISRNTVYKLTYEESENIKKDSRVLAVTPLQVELESIQPLWTQTSPFSRSTSTIAVNWKQWGLYRCGLENNITGWGSNVSSYTTGTSLYLNSDELYLNNDVISLENFESSVLYLDGNQIYLNNDLISLGGVGSTVNIRDLQTSTITVTASGKNVDLVLIDGHVDPLLSELAKNSDGSGGTRINLFNWFSLNSVVTSIDDDSQTIPVAGNYFYQPFVDPLNSTRTDDNNHGAHVLGIAVGNTNGWARDANIYIINPYPSNINGTLSSLLMWDYIRAFHKTKEVNPITGIKNPTICNGSYAQVFTYPSAITGPITRVTYRGVTTGNGTTALTTNQLLANGIYAQGGVATIGFYSPSIAADIEDAINEGIIVVGAAGNSSQKIDVVGGVDYNNTFLATFLGTTYAWYAHRGTTPGAAPNVLCVGAVSSLSTESKSIYGECGPRVDIYAPGDSIISCVNSNGDVTDPRGVGEIAVYTGTSMATPQVTGILACLLEIYPRFNQNECSNYIKSIAKLGKMTDTGGGASDLTSLQGSVNRFLFYNKERPDDGITYPKINFKLRPQAGSVWPRTKIYRYGR